MQIDRAFLQSIERLRLGALRPVHGRRDGDRRSTLLGRGVELADYRPYQPGDDLRRVDWNVFARLDAVLVRLFHEDRNLTARIFVDCSGSMRFGSPRKIDRAGELAACLAMLGLLGRDRVELCCIGASTTSATAHDPAALPRLLRLLEGAEPGGVAPLGRAIPSLSGGSRAELAFLASDLLVEEDDRNLILRSLAGSAAQGLVVHLLSAHELSPDLSAGEWLTDSETGGALAIPGGPAARCAYADGLARWLDAVETSCRSLGLGYVRVEVESPLADILRGPLFASRAIVPRARLGARGDL